MRQRADGIAQDNSAVIENFLEFRGGLGALVCGQISLATHIDRIKGPEVRMEGGARRPQLIRNRYL